MATFKMLSKCYVCEKRCDGRFFCSDKHLEIYETHNRMKGLANQAKNKATAEVNKKTLDNFFSKI